METSLDKDEKVDIKNILKEYAELEKQYLFFNCFVISSDEIKILYEKAKEKYNNYLKNIEIYYTPDYLFKKNQYNPIFDQINKQKHKDYYFLKEHVFYYQYLLKCLKVKEEKNKRIEREEIDNKNLNEIAYRTLMNRLYILSENPKSNNNYGINEIFGIPCIYSIIEPNIIDQIINMKKFNFELLQMNKDNVIKLFGINQDIEAQSYIYNKLLISISEGNSTIKDEKNANYDINSDLNKMNKSSIELEKFLIDLSSELFLFNYIMKQLGKNNLIQIPRMIFFCGLYNYEYNSIYKIQNNLMKEKEKEPEKINVREKSIDERKKIKNKGKKEIEEKNGTTNINSKHRKKTFQEIKQEEKKEKSKQQTPKKEQREKEEKLRDKRKEIITAKNEGSLEKEKALEMKKPEKNLLKCKLLNFCGTLELDGSFLYKGEKIQLEAKSFVIALSEYLFHNNDNITKNAEKYEAKGILEKLTKYKNNPKYLKSSLKNNKIFQVDIDKENIEDIKKKYKEIVDKDIISSTKIIIEKNDLILIENKREFPNHMFNEINNFIDHSLYFIALYQNLKLLEPTSEIHLLFVYDHHRNYDDVGQAAFALHQIINENLGKLNLLSNRIKFYLIHSLPNLSISIFDKLENNISDLSRENKEFIQLIGKQNSKINDLTNKNERLIKEVKNLTNENKNLIIKLSSITSQNKRNVATITNLESENRKLRTDITNLESENLQIKYDMDKIRTKNAILTLKVKRLESQNKNLIVEVNNLKNKNKILTIQNKELIEIVKNLNDKVDKLEGEINELKYLNNKKNDYNKIS